MKSHVDEEQTSHIPSSGSLKTSEVSAVPAFTPGPWRYYTGKLRPQFSTVVHEIQDSDGTAIVSWSGFDGVDFSQGQIAANARLIAAAPALYAALELLLGGLPVFPDTDTPDISVRPSSIHLTVGQIRKAQSALRLANGQATNTVASTGTTDQDAVKE